MSAAQRTDGVPDHQQEQHDGVIRQLLAEAAYRELQRALDAKGIAHLVLKGPHLAATVYDAPGERSIDDLDVLVAPQDFAHAWEALRGTGFSGPALESNGALPKKNDLALRSRSGWWVELHHALAPYGTYRVTFEELHERSEPFMFGRAAARGLCPEDLILHLVIHAAKSHYRAIVPKHVDDVARLSARREIEWEDVVARARRWGCASAAWVFLSAAVVQRGAEVPKAVLQALAPARSTQVWIKRLVALDRFPLLRYPDVPRPLMRVAMMPAMIDEPSRALKVAGRFASRAVRARRQERDPA